ncbi:MAG: glycosyltransferase [Deltaproteobacteria bacterium]|nr:glycosyltransferase [Deltaproteobacteria bacterium]
MRILLVHNRYLQRGGEDAAYDAERDLLRAAGHQVVEYLLDNREVAGRGRIALALTTVWSRRARAELAALAERERPEVAHFHNTLPLVSPAAYAALRRRGVPVVQTLHNYRLICPGALLLRDGAPCRDCVGRAVPWPGVLHACYRESRAASGVVAAMLAAHRLLGTWGREVDVYVALTRFARDLFVEGGLPAERIAVRPNFTPGGSAPDPRAPRAGALFVGRMSPEKGADLLLDAWSLLGRTGGLTLAGDGPDAPALRQRAEKLGARWMGPVPAAEVAAAMRQAAVLVIPSRCYEGFPLVLGEAFAAGLPVVASRLGAMGEWVEGGRGWTVEPGRPEALAEALREALADPGLALGRGQEARRTWERELSPEIGLERLLAIYRRAREAFARSSA